MLNQTKDRRGFCPSKGGSKMGDRAMAQIKVADYVGKVHSLYFYTHWTGNELPKHARLALDTAQERIDDPPYALKIVVDALIDLAGARDKATGAGLMFGPNCEDEYNDNNPSVVIDLTENEVTVQRRERE
jgi:hypothetical protein